MSYILVYPCAADSASNDRYPKDGPETNKDRGSATDMSTSKAGVPDSSDNPQKNAGTYLLLPLVSNMQA